MERGLRWFCLTLSAYAGVASAIVVQPAARNVALTVGVSHGLPGIGTDLNTVRDILQIPEYGFEVARLEDKEANVGDVARELEEGAAQVWDMQGTFFFYFSGHGNRGAIYPQDRTMKVEEIRAAIEKGRKKFGPVARLVLFIDSCHSGSLMDPLRSQHLADELVAQFNPNRQSSYWRELIVFASARPDETCLAGPNGSVFTNAFAKAFEEVKAMDGTLGEFLTRGAKYTTHSHPVHRLVPADLALAPLIPQP